MRELHAAYAATLAQAEWHPEPVHSAFCNVHHVIMLRRHRRSDIERLDPL